MSKALCRGLAVAVSMAAFLFLFAACAEEVAAPPPAPPSPTPVLSDLLTSAGDKVAGMSSAKVRMVDETESGAPFFTMTLKSMEAEIKAPDRFRMIVNAESNAFGFSELEMLAVGDEAVMKFAKDAPWVPLPLDLVPFNFAGLGPTLRDVLFVIRDGDGRITGKESVTGSMTSRVHGTILSEQLSDLITSADAGHEVELTFWIDDTTHILRQMRIAGQIFDDDGAETTRLLTILGMDVPVEIELPEIVSGQ